MVFSKLSHINRRSGKPPGFGDTLDPLHSVLVPFERFFYRNTRNYVVIHSGFPLLRIDMLIRLLGGFLLEVQSSLVKILKCLGGAYACSLPLLE